jgi:hypothetical protein
MVSGGSYAVTLTVDLPPELEAELRVLAAEEGVAPDAYLVHLLEERVRRRTRSPRLSTQETSLLQQINEGLPAATWQRYHALKALRQAETLTPDEQSELISLSDEIEEWNARRFGLVVELARLRGVPFASLAKELGLEAPPHA